ncbi:MAG: hypothetical protein ACK47B_00725 [Armatimonadota bacterium]
MRILLTAFEPFDGTGLNSSLEGCRLFLEQWGRHWDLRFAVLPVSYDRDTEAVERELAAERYDLLLHTGQATGASHVRPERLAVNVRYVESSLPTPESPQQWIEPDGPAALVSPLPVERITEAIRAEGVPAVTSNHAGIYLCNHVLYRSLRRRERDPTAPPAGFLHLPALPEQASAGQAFLPVEEIARAIRATIACLAGSP